MRLTGRIFKMKTQFVQRSPQGIDEVIYHLPLESELIPMNELIGHKISLKFENEIYCIHCNRRTNKSFQGFCWNCFSTSPENAECILRPELCMAHEGKGRDIEWEKRNHLQEHFVYLALSSSVKVGVTRATQVPTRWIDQGASSVIRFAKTPNRYLSGVIEVEMKKHFTDKTNWQKMLKGEDRDGINLVEEKQKARDHLPLNLKQYYFEDDLIAIFNYPVLKYPEKIKSIDLEKTPFLEGKEGAGLKLIGIKGQYLMFEDNSVLNVRKHSGYVLCIEW